MLLVEEVELKKNQKLISNKIKLGGSDNPWRHGAPEAEREVHKKRIHDENVAFKYAKERVAKDDEFIEWVQLGGYGRYSHSWSYITPSIEKK